jgi:putative component of membrane protein insertase Oxa1/YidC/SpoIIIJ protein YidD
MSCDRIKNKVRIKQCLPIIFFVLILSGNAQAQNILEKWEAKPVSYEIPNYQHHGYEINKSNIGTILISFARNVYYFLVSDLDGDNCPFYPTCSAFFVQAVKETNIIKGTLMFADRFTRDLNLFKGKNHYPVYSNNKYFDPPSNYAFDITKIKF